MRKTAFEILGVKPAYAATGISTAYKTKYREIQDGKLSLSLRELNDAYNEIKTDDRIKKYLKVNPWLTVEEESDRIVRKTGPFGDPVDDDGIPLDLRWVTPKDRANMRKRRET